MANHQQRDTALLPISSEELMILRAISIRQPYVELILQGKKKFEYRSQPTNIRERVYIYASNKLGGDENDWNQLRVEPDLLPTGLIVGSVEILGCEWDEKERSRLSLSPEVPPWQNPAIELLQRFVEVSELFDSVKKKWIPFSKDESPEEALSYFASALEDLAFQLFDEATNLANGKRTRDFGPRYRKVVEEAHKVTGNPELSVHLTTADIAYQSAIVCAPLNLANYVSLAGFYFAGQTQTSKNWVREVCVLFDQIEDKLLKTENDALSTQNRLLKEDHNSLLTKLRENINGIKVEVGLEVTLRPEIVEKESAEHSGERGLLGDSGHSKARERVLCKKCATMVIPTFHDCCPECGRFLV